MEKDTIGTFPQNGEENFWLIVNASEKSANDGPWKMALLFWGKKKRRSGVRRPRVRWFGVNLRQEEKKLLPADVAEAFDNHDNGASGSIPPPTLPTEFIEKIVELRGDGMMMVLERKLTETDQKPRCGRLILPTGKRNDEFLSPEEKENMEKKDGNNCKGMNVPLIEPNLNKSHILLRRWRTGKSTSYASCLCNNWKKVAKDNGPKPGDTIQVWSFRVQGSLSLALVKLQK